MPVVDQNRAHALHTEALVALEKRQYGWAKAAANFSLIRTLQQVLTRKLRVSVKVDILIAKDATDFMKNVFWHQPELREVALATF